MSPDLDQLVSDAAELTGAAKPSWLEDGAPVLTETDAFPEGTLDGNGDGSAYLIGIIGGKDVGKSALVNAIVGREITRRTSHGPGTETVIAFAHASRVTALRELLEREVPGKYTIIPHELPHLARQVLLDLPDIDSHWAGHVEVTRKMLRHMLFPIWMQSVEKYADRPPQELLAKVAAGNAPQNFVFCLNKVDQLASIGATRPLAPMPPPEVAGGAPVSAPIQKAIEELRSDYAARLARVLNLDAPPRVWAISAIQPEGYELPSLRALLARQKSNEIVRESKAQAAARQKLSARQWLDALDLPARAARLARLEGSVAESIAERLGEPLLEGMLPQLSEDPMYRQSVIDDCLSKRVARWPLVGMLHGIFATIGAFIRRNTESTPRPLFGHTADALVDHHLAAVTAPAGGKTLAELVQGTFATLQQTHPTLGPLYASRKLWESMPSSSATAELREELVRTVNRQRAVASSRADRHRGSQFAETVRFLLTFGALIWFPFIQPVLRHLLLPHSPQTGSLASIFVDMLGMTYLLNAMTFFLVYFSIIWLALRWDTQQRVARQFARWRDTDRQDPTLSLHGRLREWLDGLAEPVRQARDRMETLAARAEKLGDVGT